jgi:hypothetical protein
MQEKCQFLIFTHLLHEYINSLKNRKCPYNIIQNFINPIVGQINIKMIYVGKKNGEIINFNSIGKERIVQIIKNQNIG